MEKLGTVCVTGATSYIGSWLVQKLLHRGYIVHATLRNLGNIISYLHRSVAISFFLSFF
ncbi:Dihydroflavonol-4-reductase [Dendrobium catenatum]|uniref:Dihydroflavonol-4-reductase n=1 Tax=Dendrobium catenatum TaxID=906689 RepID=A0A2I0WAE9_9ASPA|nr:Dihydroflavonol-4-reductase [Dendrobium catenatum]